MANTDDFESGKAAAREIKETIKEGAAQVDADVRQTADDAGRAARQTARATRDAGPAFSDAAQSRAEDLAERLDDTLTDIYDDAVEGIRARPVTAVLLAGLTGAVLALLVRRSVA